MRWYEQTVSFRTSSRCDIDLLGTSFPADLNHFTSAPGSVAPRDLHLRDLLQVEVSIPETASLIACFLHPETVGGYHLRQPRCCLRVLHSANRSGFICRYLVSRRCSENRVCKRNNLTLGTVTVDVSDGRFVVHALVREAAEEDLLRERDMEHDLAGLW